MRPNSSMTGKRRRSRHRGSASAPALDRERRGELEALIGRRFLDPSLLDRALTHRSAAQGRAAEWSNERLEFLGDRVLALVIAQRLLERHVGEREGGLAPRLNAMVNRETCAAIAAECQIGSFLIVDGTERALAASPQPSMLADAIEAVIGAVYLDGGLEAAARTILKLWRSRLQDTVDALKDPKSLLQERVQGAGDPAPIYTDGDRHGPDHAPAFTAIVEVLGQSPVKGVGSTKQEAQRAAARSMLAQMDAAN